MTPEQRRWKWVKYEYLPEIVRPYFDKGFKPPKVKPEPSQTQEKDKKATEKPKAAEETKQ